MQDAEHDEEKEYWHQHVLLLVIVCQLEKVIYDLCLGVVLAPLAISVHKIIKRLPFQVKHIIKQLMPVTVNNIYWNHEDANKVWDYTQVSAHSPFKGVHERWTVFYYAILDKFFLIPEKLDLLLHDCSIALTFLCSSFLFPLEVWMVPHNCSNMILPGLLRFLVTFSIYWRLEVLTTSSSLHFHFHFFRLKVELKDPAECVQFIEDVQCKEKDLNVLEGDEDDVLSLVLNKTDGSVELKRVLDEAGWFSLSMQRYENKRARHLIVE